MNTHDSAGIPAATLLASILFFPQPVDSSRASTELRQRCITLISASQTERRKLKLLSERQFSSSSRFPAPWDHGFELRCDAAHRDARVPARAATLAGNWSWSIAGSWCDRTTVCSGFAAFFLQLVQRCYEKDRRLHSKPLSTLT